MSSAKITLFSFARWMKQNNTDLFLNLSVPSGIDKNTLVDNILLRGGEFEVVYSDPAFMQYAIGTWSRKWFRTMQKWIEALSIDYDPLENNDRYENWNDTSEKVMNNNRTLDHDDTLTINTKDLTTLNTENKRTINTESLETRNLTDKETRDYEDEETRDLNDTTTYDKVITTEREVSAYDSSNYQPSEKTTETDSNGNNVSVDGTGTDTFTHTGTDTFEHTGTDTTNNFGTDTMNNTGTDTLDRTGIENTAHTGNITDNGDESGVDTHAGHVHGNIGVTSSQELLLSELSVSEWNIYEHITDLFLTEFVIPIYT